MLRLALIGTLLGPAIALAGEVPDLALVGLHQSGLALEKQEALAAELVLMLKNSGLARGVVANQVAGAIQGREQVLLEEGLLGPGRAKLKAAIDLYNQAQPEAALGLLRDAIFQLERAFPGTDSIDDLWLAHMYSGSAQVQLDEDGSVEFGAAAALNSGRQPDGAIFPPQVIEAFDAIRAAGLSNPTTLTVEVTSAVPVFIDGVARGDAPVSVPGLLPGVHHVVVKGSNGSRGYERVRIEAPVAAVPEPPKDDERGEELENEETVIEAPRPNAPAEMTVSVVLEEPWLATAGASKRERSEQTAAMYRSLGARAPGVEMFLLGGIDEGSLLLQLYHAPTNSFSRSLDVPYTEWINDEVLTSMPLVVAMIGKDGLLTATDTTAVPLDVGANSALASLLLNPPEPSPLVKEVKSGEKRGGRLVLGIIAGAAVAGLAGGGVYLASQSNGGGGTTTTSTPTPILESGTVVIDL